MLLKKARKANQSTVEDQQSPLKKILSKFRPQIRSRHPSHSPFRTQLPHLPFRSLVRFGSTTEVEDNLKRVELNSVEAIRISSNKLLMKRKFRDAGVKTADWREGNVPNSELLVLTNNWKYKLVAKSHYGSRNEGNTLLSTQNELDIWKKSKNLSEYIFERFYNYTREYRLHVNKDGVFYTCRKMLKSDAPEDSSWFRNDSNCVWYLETNPSFDKPVNWDIIVGECVKALNAVGLDFCSVDLRIQSAKDNKGKVRQEPDFIVLETNSASSMGDDPNTSVVLQKYLTELPIMLKKKFLEV